MSEKQYYLVSTKHTSTGDTALTLWGHNRSGYTWHKDHAGVYTHEDVKYYEGDDGIVPVDKEAADKLFLPANDFGDKYIALPNDTTVRQILNIPQSGMKPKKYSSCRMKFQLPENSRSC